LAVAISHWDQQRAGVYGALSEISPGALSHNLDLGVSVMSKHDPIDNMKRSRHHLQGMYTQGGQMQGLIIYVFS
jgi:hypothetical protein